MSMLTNATSNSSSEVNTTLPRSVGSVTTYVVMMSLGGLIVVSNVVVLVVVVAERRGLLDDGRYLLIGCLAVTDALVGVAIGQRGLVGFINENPGGCPLFYSVINITAAASTLTLIVIAINQGIAIARPLRYHQIVTRPRLWCSVAVIVVLSLIHGTSVLWDSHHSDLCVSTKQNSTTHTLINITVLYVAAGCVFIAIYGYIYRTIRQHRKVTDSQRVAWGTPAGDDDSRLKSEYRTTVTMAILIVTYMAMWLPYTAASVHALLDPAVVPSLMWGTLGLINSLINPFVYAFRLENFRRALKRLTTCDFTTQTILERLSVTATAN